MNYAGFERQSWKGRSRLAHKALRTLEARSPAERAKLESKYGCRYSSLLQDPSRMLVIDPMHNLFLGSAKHFLKSVLLPKISNNQFDIIQAQIDFFKVPPDLGRIPNKIHSGFASFTAEQWKNWTVFQCMIYWIKLC